MKKIPWREAALFSLPCFALLGLSLVLSNSGRERNAIKVSAAQVALPSLVSVQRGADAGAYLKFDKALAEHDAVSWKTDLRLVAGNSLLWDNQNGGPSRAVISSNTSSGPGRAIISSNTSTGNSYEWRANFDLDSIPASWGEVALKWDIKLTHTTTRWLRTKTLHSQRNGKIILRRAGQKLPPPQVSRDLHLKILRYEIGKPKVAGDKTYSYFTYPLKFHFERDAATRDDAPRINCDYEVKPREGFVTFSSRNGSDDASRFYYDRSDAIGATHRRYPVVTHEVDTEKIAMPGKSFIIWKIRHGDFWEKQMILPFSDAKGRVLIGIQKFAESKKSD